MSWMILLAAIAPAGEPPFDLGAHLREALANNPEIAAAIGRVAAAETIASQLEAPPDPVAGLSLTNVGLGGLELGDEDDAELTISWEQEVPYPGKLRLAGEAGRILSEASRHRLEQVRLDVAARVKRSFAELYHSDRSAAILDDSRRLLVSFLETARARYESGEGLLQNVLKAQTEVSRLDARLERLVEERRVAQSRLNALAGRPGDPAPGPALTLPEMTSPLDLVELEAQALSRSPEQLDRQAQVSLGQARLDLAKRQVRPDFLWAASYGYRGDIDPIVMGGVGIRLPLHRQRRQVQGIAQAAHELEAARQESSAGRLRLATEVRELAAAAQRAERLERLYLEGVIPQARSALESAAAAYAAGRVEFLALISDFGTLLDYEMDYVTQHHERFLALAELERLTAGRLILVEGAP